MGAKNQITSFKVKPEVVEVNILGFHPWNGKTLKANESYRKFDFEEHGEKYVICQLCGRAFVYNDKPVCIATLKECYNDECQGNCKKIRYKRKAKANIHKKICPYCRGSPDIPNWASNDVIKDNSRKFADSQTLIEQPMEPAGHDSFDYGEIMDEDQNQSVEMYDLEDSEDYSDSDFSDGFEHERSGSNTYIRDYITGETLATIKDYFSLQDPNEDLAPQQRKEMLKPSITREKPRNVNNAGLYVRARETALFKRVEKVYQCKGQLTEYVERKKGSNIIRKYKYVDGPLKGLPRIYPRVNYTTPINLNIIRQLPRRERVFNPDWCIYKFISREDSFVNGIYRKYPEKSSFETLMQKKSFATYYTESLIEPEQRDLKPFKKVLRDRHFKMMLELTNLAKSFLMKNDYGESKFPKFKDLKVYIIMNHYGVLYEDPLKDYVPFADLEKEFEEIDYINRPLDYTPDLIEYVDYPPRERSKYRSNLFYAGGLMRLYQMKTVKHDYSNSFVLLKGPDVPKEHEPDHYPKYSAKYFQRAPRFPGGYLTKREIGLIEDLDEEKQNRMVKAREDWIKTYGKRHNAYNLKDTRRINLYAPIYIPNWKIKDGEIKETKEMYFVRNTSRIKPAKRDNGEKARYWRQSIDTFNKYQLPKERMIIQTVERGVEGEPVKRIKLKWISKDRWINWGKTKNWDKFRAADLAGFKRIISPVEKTRLELNSNESQKIIVYPLFKWKKGKFLYERFQKQPESE